MTTATVHTSTICDRVETIPELFTLQHLYISSVGSLHSKIHRASHLISVVPTDVKNQEAWMWQR